MESLFEQLLHGSRLAIEAAAALRIAIGLVDAMPSAGAHPAQA